MSNSTTADVKHSNLDSDSDIKAAASALNVTEEKVRELKAKHGKLVLITHPEIEWSGLFVRPNRIVWKRFRAAITSENETKKNGSTEDFALSCAVHPDRRGFDAVLEEYPGLAETVTSVLTVLAGGAKEGMASGKLL